MKIHRTVLAVTPTLLDTLKEVTKQYPDDLVLVPFKVLSALKDNKIRDEFPNVVSYNSTPETQRSHPNDKVVDINNWSY